MEGCDNLKDVSTPILNMRRRKSTGAIEYGPNQKWLLQGFMFLGFFPVVVLLLSKPDDPIFLAMMISLFLIGGIFLSISRFSSFTLKNGTLSQHDLFTSRELGVNSITSITVTKEGFFGATRIAAGKLEIILNHAFFDKPTINDLIADIHHLNPGVKVLRD
jgi:hypothetical protein